eukprot:TRINITY_DN1206_c0_g1_i3.p1 TRINITY_DN1206_c0_g1~~TRINITY_DN1206_c0_g1_i3.p1  ORF type:complete len:330 (+),score=49.29 TRINITY_DN1206_c0_g1_i3:322-1311(+)
MKLHLKMKVKILLLVMIFLGEILGRPLLDVDFSSTFSRKLQQFIGNCSKGSDQILTEYPSAVSLRNPLNQEEPNENVLCGGVLLSTDTLLTSTGCIYQDLATGVPFDLVIENPVNRTIERDFKVAISPYCAHGDGAEVLQIMGYHYMEDKYTGYPIDGNAVAVLELNSSVTSLADEELAPLRQRPMPPNTVLTMVGHGATTIEEALIYNQNYSRPAKIVNFLTISDEECEQLLNYLQGNKLELDGNTESCAVVQIEGDDVNICNGDDGNPLFDSEGNIAGVVTWWAINQCEEPRDRPRPLLFADVTKNTVAAFINQTENNSCVKTLFSD